MPDVDTLCEMGFPRNRAEKALHKTNYRGVQAAMDWLLEHSEDADIDDPFEAPQGQTLGSEPAPGGATAQPSTAEEETPTAKSLKCDDCGKVLRNTEEAELHAARTKHTNFSESTEEKKPLTEEELKEQKERLQQKLVQRRAEREAREKAEALEREKSRRTSGRQIANIKQKYQEDEMKKLAEERRREKQADKIARQKIKEKIEQDKRDRAEKAAAQKAPKDSSSSTSSTAQASGSQPAVKKEYDTARIQIRLPGGQAITHTFGAQEPLSAIRLYIEVNRTDGESGPFSLCTNFPKKVFTAADMDAPLKSLGLVPSAVLMVTK